MQREAAAASLLRALPRRGVRTVTGRSDHVVIVGAGLAGLSCAMHLAAAGRRVSVLEREAVPGGRAGQIVSETPSGTYRFDPGPTVLTMPDLIDDCFDALGERREDWVTLEPVRPLYRARYADGSTLDVHADTDEMACAIEDFAGADEATGYRRYVDLVRRMYDVEMRHFIDRNFDSPLDVMSPELAKLVALGGMRRLSRLVEQYLRDPRLQRVFSFQALYAGVAPQQALGFYAVISYMDSVAGVFHAKGGMHAIPRAMADAAAKHGVEFRYGTTVTAVEHDGGRARAVVTETGERIPADVVVLNPDTPVVKRDLLGLREPQVLSSPSCWLLLAGTSTPEADAAHHTISFGLGWSEIFADLTSGRLMRDPSVLVSQPTVSEPDLAPPGHGIAYVLFPTPNLDPRHGEVIDWARYAPTHRAYAEEVLGQRGFGPLLAGTEVEHTITPDDWEAMGMHHGTPFAAAHTFGQTGPFRASNLWGENVVFTGSGTTPGVGVPMVLISGRLAAERITGPVPGYRSRAWR